MKAARAIGYDFERGTEGPSMHSLRFNLSWRFLKGFSNDLCPNQFDFLIFSTKNDKRQKKNLTLPVTYIFFVCHTTNKNAITF